MSDLVGKSYQFDDGNIIEVIQAKMRDVNHAYVSVLTYQIISPGCLPRKLVMHEDEFIHTYGHLFGIKEPPQYPR
jgi:hypothetical protein